MSNVLDGRLILKLWLVASFVLLVGFPSIIDPSLDDLVLLLSLLLELLGGGLRDGAIKGHSIVMCNEILLGLWTYLRGAVV